VSGIRRRDFVNLLGGAAAWPVAARAQQPAMPVIGYLNNGSPESDTFRLTGLRRGLNETGYFEGRNLVIEYRWAANQADRLPALAADLVQRRVAVIVAPGLMPTLAAKAATTSIPILFSTGVDPVQLGLVASLNRPGGNLTGVNLLSGELGAKGLALMHDLVPSIETISFLENPNNPVSELNSRDVVAAAPALGLKVQILKASSDREIDAAVAGGLISYGISLSELYRQVGLYAGRILKGEKPTDLPVMQATKIALIINLKTARILGLEVPAKLLALADEVIE